MFSCGEDFFIVIEISCSNAGEIGYSCTCPAIREKEVFFLYKNEIIGW
jgi:hypothetical protein